MTRFEHARCTAVRPDEILATRSGFDHRWLELIRGEIVSFDEISDDDFARLVECLIELAPNTHALARAAGLEVGALSAWTNSGKRSGVDESFSSAERDRILRVMHHEVVAQIGSPRKGARMMNEQTIGKLCAQGRSKVRIAEMVREDISRCTSNDMSADTFLRFVTCFARLDPQFVRRTAMALRFDEAVMYAWVERRDRGSTLPQRIHRQTILLLILDTIESRLARQAKRESVAA